MRKKPPPHPRDIPPDPMIVVRPPPSRRERLFHVLVLVARWVARFLFLIIIFVLCSIGITALINEPLRNILIDHLQIGGFL